MTKKKKEKVRRRTTKASASARATAKATVKGRDKIIVVQGASSSSSGGGGAASTGGHSISHPPPLHQPPIVMPFPLPQAPAPQDWMDVHQRYTDNFERRLGERLNETRDQLNHLHSEVDRLRGTPPSLYPSPAQPMDMSIQPSRPSYAPQAPDQNYPMDMSASIPPPEKKSVSVQAAPSVHGKDIQVKREDDMSELSEEYEVSVPGLPIHEVAGASSVRADTVMPPSVDPTQRVSPGSVASSSVHVLGPASVNTVDLPEHMDLVSRASSKSSKSSSMPPSVKFEVKPEIKKDPYASVKVETVSQPTTSIVKMEESTPEFPKPTDMMPPTSQALVSYEKPQVVRNKNDSKRLAIAESAVDMGILESKDDGSMSKASSKASSKSSYAPPPRNTDSRRVPTTLRSRLATLENAQREVQDTMRQRKPPPQVARAYVNHTMGGNF